MFLLFIYNCFHKFLYKAFVVLPPNQQALLISQQGSSSYITQGHKNRNKSFTSARLDNYTCIRHGRINFFENRIHRNNWKIPFMLSMLCVIFRIADVIIVFYAQNDVIFEIIWIYACLNSIFFRCLNIGNSSEPSIFIICNKVKILWCNVMQLYCMCIKGIEN